ncbi:RNA-directed DNA polymerase from mobile element jockey, partial [Aphis craccivora]
WYVSNPSLYTDLKIPTIHSLASHYYKPFHKNLFNPSYSLILTSSPLHFLKIHQAVLCANGPWISTTLKKYILIGKQKTNLEL